MIAVQTQVYLNTDAIPYYEEGSSTVTIRVQMSELPRIGETVDVLSILVVNQLTEATAFAALSDFLLESGAMPYVREIRHSFVKEEDSKKRESIVQQVVLYLVV